MHFDYKGRFQENLERISEDKYEINFYEIDDEELRAGIVREAEEETRSQYASEIDRSYDEMKEKNI
jgi:hypothetical protein